MLNWFYFGTCFFLSRRNKCWLVAFWGKYWLDLDCRTANRFRNRSSWIRLFSKHLVWWAKWYTSKHCLLLQGWFWVDWWAFIPAICVEILQTHWWVLGWGAFPLGHLGVFNTFREFRLNEIFKFDWGFWALANLLLFKFVLVSNVITVRVLAITADIWQPVIFWWVVP
jgi:hypothetical protein